MSNSTLPPQRKLTFSLHLNLFPSCWSQTSLVPHPYSTPTSAQPVSSLLHFWIRCTFAGPSKLSCVLCPHALESPLKPIACAHLMQPRPRPDSSFGSYCQLSLPMASCWYFCPCADFSVPPTRLTLASGPRSSGDDQPTAEALLL